VADDRLITGYAQALLAIAEAEGDLESVEDELYVFSKTIQRQPELREALTDPQLPVERKKALLQELLGQKVNRHTVSLLGFIVEQGRAKDLDKIVAALAELAAERRRHALAEVRSATALDDERRTRLTQALSKATGKELEVKVVVDPRVIGGVVAYVGDQVFDGTIKHKLELARQQLGASGAAR
jgi:F-type H+-transporting ATPase subunit delta